MQKGNETRKKKNEPESDRGGGGGMRDVKKRKRRWGEGQFDFIYRCEESICSGAPVTSDSFSLTAIWLVLDWLIIYFPAWWYWALLTCHMEFGSTNQILPTHFMR